VAKQKGMTLAEMTVVISIAALMVALTLPAANMLFNSFESESGAKSMINAALASARAIAIKEQRYAGIRFQKRFDPNNPDPLNASQYMIFIVYDYDKTGLANGFRAVEGIQPIKLSDSIGVMDLTLVQRYYPPNRYVATITESSINDNSLIDQMSEVGDTTAFSIIFSPSGKLVVHEVQIRNRNGIPDTTGQVGNSSNDDIFNKKGEVDEGLAMFYQDDYCSAWWSPWVGFNVGLGPEFSRNKFYIYETKIFKQAYKAGNPWTGYLERVAQKPVYINPYTGTIINEK
jgi:prepilin-type N-terminal cleavage/methylation domain-containing protein